jgi:hypothetical protein
LKSASFREELLPESTRNPATLNLLRRNLPEAWMAAAEGSVLRMI